MRTSTRFGPWEQTNWGKSKDDSSLEKHSSSSYCRPVDRELDDVVSTLYSVSRLQGQPLILTRDPKWGPKQSRAKDSPTQSHSWKAAELAFELPSI